MFAYRFGGFRLDPGKRRLTGPDGPMQLSARAFDVLVHLVGNRERIVGKDELLNAVWPRSVVEDNNLSQAITAVRRALGDSRDAPRFVATIAGRGYQFVCEVVAVPTGESALAPICAPSEDVDRWVPDDAMRSVDQAGATPSGYSLTTGQRDPAEPAGSSGGTAAAHPQAAIRVAKSGPVAVTHRPASLSRRVVLGGLGATAIAAIGASLLWHRGRAASRRPRSIAVLPFRPLLADARNPALELGVTEQLINRLSRIPGIVVAPLSSVITYAGDGTDPLDAGRKLGVDAVVDGRIQVQDQRIRLTARLLAVDDGAALWANSFTEMQGELLAVQDSLAAQIYTAMAVELSEEARSRMLTRETTDVEAWQLYANGRFQVDRRNAAGLERAIEYLEAALRRDPRFARAAAWLADAHTLTAVFGLASPRVAFERARRAAEQALELDPMLPDAHMAMGHVMVQGERRFAAGRERQLRALQLEPRFARSRTQLALVLCQIGDVAGATEEMRKAVAHEPGSPAIAAVQGWIAYHARKFDEAERHLQRVVETYPDVGLARHFLARVLLAGKRGTEVVRLLANTSYPAPTAFSDIGRAYAQSGDAAAARSEVARLEALGTRGFGVGFDLALIHLELGERERALGALAHGVDDLSQLMGYVNVEPALDPLRGEARFQAIVRRIGLA